MKKANLPALVAAALAIWAVPLFCQSQDLSGTWVGETVVPNSADKDQVTLVLKKDGDSYSGTITDGLGMLNSTPLENVKLEGDTLTAEFLILDGNEDVRIWMILKVSGEKLIGSWQDSGDAAGTLELERKKD